MANNAQRPRFYEGQYLGAEDLTAALDYGREGDARHVLGAHTWGIAVGLELVERKGAGGQTEIAVLPGYAWDGFGRPIVLLAQQKLSSSLFDSIRHRASDEPDGRPVDVWIAYDETTGRDPRYGFEVCDTGDQRARVQESARFFVGDYPSSAQRHTGVVVAGQTVDADAPFQRLEPTAPHLYDESVPFQELPSNGSAFWLVPIGTVRWKPGATPSQPGEFKPRTAADKAQSRAVRRYVGVVVESVLAADARVRVRRRSDDPAAGFFTMPDDDLLWVEGNLDVEGSVKIVGGRLELRDLNGDDYKAPLALQRVGDPGPGPRALEVVVGTATASPAHRLAIGPQKSDTDTTVDEKVVVLGSGEVGLGTTTPGQMLTLGSPEGTRLEITRTSGTLPWRPGDPRPGAFVINQQSQGSSEPGADFALMRDRKKRVILFDRDTGLSGQDGGAVIFFVNHDETGAKEVMRVAGSGRVGIGSGIL